VKRLKDKIDELHKKEEELAHTESHKQSKKIQQELKQVEEKEAQLLKELTDKLHELEKKSTAKFEAAYHEEDDFHGREKRPKSLAQYGDFGMGADPFGAGGYGGAASADDSHGSDPYASSGSHDAYGGAMAYDDYYYDDHWDAGVIYADDQWRQAEEDKLYQEVAAKVDEADKLYKEHTMQIEEEEKGGLEAERTRIQAEYDKMMSQFDSMYENQKALEAKWFNGDHHSESVHIAQEWKHTQEVEAHVFQDFTNRLHEWQAHAEEQFVITIHDAAGDQQKIEEERKHRHEEEEKLYKEMEGKMH